MRQPFTTDPGSFEPGLLPIALFPSNCSKIVDMSSPDQDAIII